MIEIQQLTKAELDELRSEARASVMALPFLMTIATILAWLFDFYWVSFFIMTIIISVIFLFLYLNQGRDTIDDDIKEGVKLLRMGKIVDVTMQTGAQTRLKSLDITLEEEPIPDPYPEIHTFGIYNSLMQLYHEPDDSLPARHQSLKGKTVLIEYFPYSGHVLSFQEEGK